jgi:hypothetical protein
MKERVFWKEGIYVLSLYYLSVVPVALFNYGKLRILVPLLHYL